MIPNDLHPELLTAKRVMACHYDGRFLEAYDNFLDKIATLFNKYNVVDFEASDYVPPVMAINYFIDRINMDTSMEECTLEALYEDFVTPLADDLLDTFSDFTNSTPYPCGLYEIVKGLPQGYFLVEVMFDEDQDLTWYSFDDGEDSQ